MSHESYINLKLLFPYLNASGTVLYNSTGRLFDMRLYGEVNTFGQLNILSGITLVVFSWYIRLLFTHMINLMPTSRKHSVTEICIP